MFTATVFWFFLAWNWLLQAVGRFIGRMTGGLVLGYNQGIRDLQEMQQYMRWRSVALKNARNKTEAGSDEEPF